jgi:hypothetical protein
MNPVPNCEVRIVRRSGYADWFRQYKILLNGTLVGSIARNSTLDLSVPCGPAMIEARIDWGRSRPLRIEATPERRLEIEVANNWGASFGLWAITFGRGSYLVLRQSMTA